ncbi:MAG: right-handed parallel beta-helix repeat-containing protein, partial [Ignavibacteriaceae bacterium]
MRSYILKILIPLVLFIVSCADRSLFTDPGIDPGLGGVYTKINGQLSGILTKSNSPYLVTDNIYIDEGTNLVIEAGVLVFFKNETGLNITGGLKAIGSKEDQIFFKAFEEGWEGIHAIDPTDSLIFIFCNIEDVYLPHESALKYGAIETTNANLMVKNCYFFYNYTQFGGALALFSTNSEIANNIFYYNESVVYGGAILSQNSSNKIINNTFYKNYCLNFGGGLVLVDPVSEEIQNNIFFDNFSYLGDPRIDIVSGDSSNVFEEYNFLAFGEMDPLFISNRDFHLTENSPCKNAGNPEAQY